MTKTVTLPLHIYEFSQNNSGGSFVEDENLAHWVFVEATSPEQATSKILELGAYEDDGSDCPCCGSRWYVHNPNLVTLEKLNMGWNKNWTSVEEYVQFMCNNYGRYGKNHEAVIHYYDGTKKYFLRNKDA